MSARQAAPLADGRALARSWLRSGGTTTTQSPNEAAARPPCDGGGRCGSSSDNRPGCPRVPDGFTVGRPPEGGRPVLRTSRGSPCAHLYTGGRAGDPRAQRAARLLSFFVPPQLYISIYRIIYRIIYRSIAVAHTWRVLKPRAPPASTRRVLMPRATPQLLPSALFERRGRTYMEVDQASCAARVHA